SIRLQAEANTWQEAVKIGVDLLVAADVVEPRYYQAILDGVEQFGPYFVIAPGLAMPHGRPGEGVKKTGFSLVTLKKPLEFNHEDNNPVDILITMAEVDANTQQEVGIMQIVYRSEDHPNLHHPRRRQRRVRPLDQPPPLRAAQGRVGGGVLFARCDF
ncbi:PTS ascorbate transporter subunit IIA, partial [Pseudoxanthomonas winnipegensis]|uniref:PTS ascorbate transporter subunit IIA n=1 Tax=Pseudoxanthomonas winnipegensis TaxID=2480810 RepID=UPI0019802B12